MENAVFQIPQTRIPSQRIAIKGLRPQDLLQRLEQLVLFYEQVQFQQKTAQTTSIEPISPSQPTEDQQLIAQFESTVKENIDDATFGVPEFARAVMMSQMKVYRKLKSLVGKTPSQFIRSVRLQNGKELIQTTDLTIAEIAYDCGFTDPNYFTRTFHQEFGKPPRDFR